MATCRLCRQERKLIKAHIIPRSLYAPLFEDGSPVKVYSTEKGIYPKRAPQGIYDSKILCDECDHRIGDWDNAAQRFLLTPLKQYGDPAAIEERGWFEASDFDYTRLKLFFISLLWRAHITSHPFFAKVELGPWERIARKRIISEEPGTVEDFSTLLARYEHPLAMALRNPEYMRFYGLNYYRFRAASYVAIIKVDKRPIDRDLLPFALAADRPIVVRLHDFLSSSEFKKNIESIAEMRE
jgi:hypothetical protein